jgi:hypothetical protein
MAVYGDMLAYFPELMVTHTVFNMQARIGGGYGPRTDIMEVYGVFMWVSGGKMGIAADNREANDVATFWVREEDVPKVRQGKYLEVPGKGIFVFNHDDDYTAQGAFAEFTLQLVPGPTDRQHKNPTVDLGVRDYA